MPLATMGAVLQTFRKHTLTCTDAHDLANFGTYSAHMA
jgi:hypothetical protein